MCGRFTMLAWEEVAQVIEEIETGRKLAFAAGTAPNEEAFPGNTAPVIVSGTDMIEPRQLSWGFVLPDTGKLVFNTRLETAASSRFWSEAYERRRCIVPAWAFCETHREQTAATASGRRVKQAYRFSRPGGEPLLMAGIWQDGRFSVMTTMPDAAVAPVHDRMPLLLDSPQALDWLVGNEPERCGFELTKAPVYPAAPAHDGGEQLGLF